MMVSDENNTGNNLGEVTTFSVGLT